MALDEYGSTYTHKTEFSTEAQTLSQALRSQEILDRNAVLAGLRVVETLGNAVVSQSIAKSEVTIGIEQILSTLYRQAVEANSQGWIQPPLNEQLTPLDDMNVRILASDRVEAIYSGDYKNPVVAVDYTVSNFL